VAATKTALGRAGIKLHRRKDEAAAVSRQLHAAGRDHTTTGVDACVSAKCHLESFDSLTTSSQR